MNLENSADVVSLCHRPSDDLSLLKGKNKTSKKKKPNKQLRLNEPPFDKACLCDNDAQLCPLGMSGLVVSVTHLMQQVIGCEKKGKEKKSAALTVSSSESSQELCATPDVINIFLPRLTRLSRLRYLRPSGL